MDITRMGGRPHEPALFWGRGNISWKMMEGFVPPLRSKWATAWKALFTGNALIKPIKIDLWVFCWNWAFYWIVLWDGDSTDCHFRRWFYGATGCSWNISRSIYHLGFVYCSHIMQVMLLSQTLTVASRNRLRGYVKPLPVSFVLVSCVCVVNINKEHPMSKW